MSTIKEKLVMDKEQIASAVKKLAKEIVAANGGTKDLLLIGVLNRGLPLAERIAKAISQLEKSEVPVGALDVSLHRDDVMDKGSNIEMKRSDIPFSIDGKIVVLVDDVIFAGRTIRAAMDGLNDYGRPSKIQLAALIDRDHRELPIHPDYVGMTVDTSASEDVLVNVSEIDGVDKVIIK
jgi:pyrimidine operon attenuation protein/uracil phosphoribosyltransferase